MSGGHTPGAWKLNHRGDEVIKSGGKSAGLTIARITPFIPLYRNEQEANAHLIAAAPELLEALEAASALATCCMAQGCYSHDELTEMARATKPAFDAAIAKAKGGAA
jgi:hypothetical protein